MRRVLLLTSLLTLVVFGLPLGASPEATASDPIVLEGSVTGGGWFYSPPGSLHPVGLALFDDSYYELVPVEPGMSWYEANDAANAMALDVCEGAHLATITSVDEQAVVSGLMAGTSQNAWIGGFQPETELVMDANWQWVTAEPFSFTNWAGGEPNDNPYGTHIPGSEQYLETYQESGFWNDAPGHEAKAYYVVEYEDCYFGPTGKATFGFVSMYEKGASVPTGNAHLNFQVGGLKFQSSSYDWLAVTGSQYATFQGVGTINGAGSHTFQIWVEDDDPDTLRIRIWTVENNTETVVYDNGVGQAIDGGNIVIHIKK